MTGIPYPPKNCRIVFREPFPTIVYGDGKTYRIKACIDNRPEKDIQLDLLEQLQFIDELIAQDGKLLNAVVMCIDGRFVIMKHSPQLDFFKEVGK